MPHGDVDDAYWRPSWKVLFCIHGKIASREISIILESFKTFASAEKVTTFMFSDMGWLACMCTLHVHGMTGFSQIMTFFKKNCRTGGIKGLFTGVGPRVGRAGPSVGIVVSFYEVVKYILHQRHNSSWKSNVVRHGRPPLCILSWMVVLHCRHTKQWRLNAVGSVEVSHFVSAFKVGLQWWLLLALHR